MPIQNYKDKNNDEIVVNLYSNIYIKTSKSNTCCNSRDGTNQFYLFNLISHFMFNLIIIKLTVMKIVKDINIAKMRLCKEG